MNVAIIGGSGFVGGYLIDTLLAAGHTVSALTRSDSESKLRHADKIRVCSGNLGSQAALDEACKGCEAVIYNVGILREFPRRGITFEETQYRGVERTLAAAKKAGVKRFLLMSANGVRAGGTLYQDTKIRAEVLVRNSGLDFIIFRPSVIFGDPRGLMEIGTQLYRDMVRPPVPAIGFYTGWLPTKGAIKMSPVHVQDVADAFAAGLQDTSLLGKTLELGGPESLTWTEMIRRVAEVSGKRNKFIVPMPVGLMKLAAFLLDWLPPFPVTRDQLTMLEEGNVASPGALTTILKRELRPFTPADLDYLKR